MSDPLHEPAAGDVSPLVNDLGAVRAVLEAARAYRAQKAPGAAGIPGREIDPPHQSLTVLVKNSTGSSLPALSVVTPTGVVTDPTTDTATMPYFARKRACFTAAAPAATDDPVFITYDGFDAPDKIGRAVCQGVVPCQVSVSDAAHEFARPAAGVTATLASATSGPARILWKESGTGTKWALVLLIGDEVATAAATVSQWKEPVRVATTVAGTLSSSFENGDAVDGVTLATGDRILIKNQVATSENGIYVVQASGAPARAADADAGSELPGAVVYVLRGTVNADTGWACTTDPTVTIGSTGIVWDKRLVPAATRTNDGYVTTTTQAFAGKKTIHQDTSGSGEPSIVLDPAATTGGSYGVPSSELRLNYDDGTPAGLRIACLSDDGAGSPIAAFRLGPDPSLGGSYSPMQFKYDSTLTYHVVETTYFRVLGGILSTDGGGILPSVAGKADGTYTLTLTVSLGGLVKTLSWV